MNHRDTILGRIRQALADRPEVEAPPVPEVWPETNPDRKTMLARFAAELEAVQGELHWCGSLDSARAKLTEVLGAIGCKSFGGVDRPLARALTDGLTAAEVSWVGDETDKDTIGRLDAALLNSDLLLADTGSCLVECRTAVERMMCYLPPVCFIVARAESLREHLPAAWREVAPQVADSSRRGEFVFITGPSRTADIEKILILGVHGPKRVIVLVVE
ncbi:MAG: LUD domain-containing protein [Pirellulaceae bacterium]|nr:LUD domain-containing protein [Pirellulaceae bacterium]